MNDTNSPQDPRAASAFSLEEEELRLGDLLDILLRRRLIILSVFAAVFVGAVLYAFLATPIYEAALTLHVADQKVKGSGGILDDLGLSRENPVQTEIQILKARSNVEEVVRRLHLQRHVEVEKGEPRIHIGEFTVAGTWKENERVFRLELTGDGGYRLLTEDKRLLGTGAAGAPFDQEGIHLLLNAVDGAAGDVLTLSLLPFQATVAGWQGSLNAGELGKGTNIISLTCQAADPVLAREVVNTLAQVYLDRNVAVKSQEASRSVEFIGDQLRQVRAGLDAAEKNLEGYQSTAGVVKLDSEVLKQIQLAADIEKELAALELRRQQANFAGSALRRAIDFKQSYTPTAFLEDPGIAALAAKMAQIEVERRGLAVEMTPAHPTMRNLDAQTASLQRRLLASYESIQQGLDNREKALRRQLAEHEKALRGLPATERELAQLTRMSRVNADIYTFLLQKQEEARIAKASTISSINIVDPAITPRFPVKPKKKMVVALGLVGGLMLGIGGALFAEHLDDTIKDAETAKKIYGWPLLAVIPYISRRENSRMICHHKPKAAASEAFRGLRTAISFSAVIGAKKRLLVSSSFQGEGKSITSVNLAIVLAQTGARVLLIDCDMRRPNQHKIFGVEAAPGLSDFLVSDGHLISARQPTEIPNLDLLPGGTIPPNPSELLGSERFRQLIDDFSLEYDHIIFDTPPALLVADARIASTFADLVVLVVESGRVPVKAAQRLAEQVRAGKAPMAGFVLNDKSRKQAGYYGYYGGYGKYRYGGESYYAPEDAAAARPWWQRLLKRDA
ncbi:MAG: polysaccharide biosynthesis tyrosine autokinase [Deltaproteobacteria bacterium]|nr:polysaccharide biosynthesis tyrosine autokinase [Deltaproteobacteria bacterium]